MPRNGEKAETAENSENRVFAEGYLRPTTRATAFAMAVSSG
jgi:hypothetical protein